MGAEGRGGFLLHTVYTILGDSPFLVNRNFQIENSLYMGDRDRKGHVDNNINRL
jgi:hypothetical protein